MAMISTMGAFRKGLVSQLNPKMIAAVLLPFLATLFLVIILLIFALSPLAHFFMLSAGDNSWFYAIANKLSHWGVSSIGHGIAWILAFITLCAISAIIGLAIASAVVTPLVLKQLSENNYQDLAKKGDSSMTAGLGNTIKVTLICIAGWMITLPLWFIPLMPIILSLFWGAYAFSHLNRVDVIVEHANAAELQTLLKQETKGFWGIGFICAGLSLIPFVSLVMPVYSIIVSAHYGLSALQDLRQKALT